MIIQYLVILLIKLMYIVKRVSIQKKNKKLSTDFETNT